MPLIYLNTGALVRAVRSQTRTHSVAAHELYSISELDELKMQVH